MAVLEEFEQKPTFIEKMKYLCSSLECPLMDEESKKLILIQVDTVFSNYYTVLGSRTIYGLSYQRSKLEAEFKKLTGNQDINIKDKVYSEFQVGDKLISSDLKERLRDIYKDLSYNKSPKARDLEEWFDLKPIKLKDESGKWVHGLEILKKK